MRGAILALATLLYSGYSLGPASDELPISPPPIVAVDTIPDVFIKHGDTTSVTVSITVAVGYHVQANPASGEFLIPLEMRLDPVEGLVFGSPEYPQGVAYRLENSEDVLLTYGGTFAVRVSITALSAGTFEVAGNIRYQACDSRRCLFPSSVPIAFKVAVGEKQPKEMNHD